MSRGGASPTQVIIAQRLLPHYHLPLYEKMQPRLAGEGVDLSVIYGDPHKEHAAKNDVVELAPPVGIKVRNTWLSPDQLLYQPVLGRLMGADLVVAVNGAAYIPTYLLLMQRRRRTPKLGFWVYHTEQWSQDRSLKEKVRRRLVRQGDWWFAYTGASRDYLTMDGIPDDRITVLSNSIDTTAFRQALESISTAEVERFAAQLGIPSRAPVGLFCGGLHRKKRFEFLFESLRLIHQQRPDFHLVMVGDGICRDVVEAAAGQDPRIHYLGARFGRDKALCFRLAQQFLCPGLVGLAILDAFVAGLPLLTTDLIIHSPEIVYLRPGENGLMTADDTHAYAEAVVGLIQSQSRWESLHLAALADSRQYSVEQMADQFCDGILGCLERPPAQ